MKLHWITLCAAALLTQAVSAQTAPAGAQGAEGLLKTNLDKASYGIGLNIGRSIQEQRMELNLSALYRGIADAVAGRPPLLPENELQSALMSFQQEMAAKTAEQDRVLAEKNKREGEAFLAANRKQPGVITLPSGLQYQVIAHGNGPSPTASDTVQTHYRGTLIDGAEFDSSLRRGEPAEFQVGRVIPGWTEALLRMRVGDKWRLFVPSELAYGENGAGSRIGPHAVLIFEVELLGIAQ